MKTIATTILQSNTGKEYNYTVVVYSNCRGCVRELEFLDAIPSTSPRPYMLLDLLAQILPKNLYAPYQVKLAMNPIYNPCENYQGHPCLVVYSANGYEKRYRLDHVVTDYWMKSVPASHLRSMVVWWRANRDEVQYPIHKWFVWSTKEE